MLLAAILAFRYIGQEEERQLPILGEAADFALTNQDGQEVRLSHLRGKVVLLDFFYTNCPDVCPLLNEKMKFIWHHLDEGLRQDLVLLSISFDTLDTPEVLREYAAARGFDIGSWQFLSGSEEQISQVTNDYGVVYWLEDDGSLTHNVVVVLIDRDGMLRKGYYSPYIPDDEMIADVTSVLSRP